MPTRVFLTPEALAGELVPLPEADAHHLRTVLRLGVGSEIVLHDGAGNACPAEIVSLDKRSVVARRSGPLQPLLSESTTRITVFQALPKIGEKIEQVLQHGTELGAAAFVVFASERSQTRLEAGERREKKLLRWREIVRSAAEQSGRGVLPDVSWANEPMLIGFDQVFCLHGESSSSLKSALGDGQKIALLVGPEGGFSGREVAAWTTNGAIGATLGPRILRTETAALAAIAQILCLRDG